VFTLPRTRVFIADSEPTDVDLLMAILGADPEIEVMGVAATGKQAIDLVADLRPDIIIMSEFLKGLDCLEAIKQIMAYSPTPILVLTAPDGQHRDETIIKAISMGALDVVEKPLSATETYQRGGFKSSSLVEAVKLLSRIKVVTHLAGKIERNRLTNNTNEEPIPTLQKPRKLVAIAASTGGPTALAEVLGRLPAGPAMGLVIVQHVAEGFSAGLADWLNKESELVVREAQDGEWIESGFAFIAPTGFQMSVKNGNQIKLEKGAPVSGHRPSADVLFMSVAEAYKTDSIGVILTGMGSDGANGVVAIKRAGGRTIAQDEQSCVVFGMPQAAIQKGMVDEVVPLESIAERIEKLCR